MALPFGAKPMVKMYGLDTLSYLKINMTNISFIIMEVAVKIEYRFVFRTKGNSCVFLHSK